MDRSPKASRSKTAADTQLRYLSEKYVRGRSRPDAAEPAASVVAELRCQSARSLFRLRDEFLKTGRPDAQTALAGTFGKQKLVERMAGLVVAPDAPVTTAESTRALAQLQRKVHEGAESDASLEGSKSVHQALQQAWSGPTRDVVALLPDVLEERVRARLHGEAQEAPAEQELQGMTVALAELPYAILDNLEHRLRSAAPPERFRAYRPSRKRESKIRNVLGLLQGLGAPGEVVFPTSADAAEQLIEQQRELPSSPDSDERLQWLKLLACELREAEGRHQGWRYDLGFSIAPPKLAWTRSLLGVNLETHHFGRETCRYLTAYLSYPAPLYPFSTGLSIPLSRGQLTWKNLKPTFRAGYFGWGRWGPLGQLPFEDAALTAEGGDMLGVTLGAKALQQLRVPGSHHLAPTLPGVGAIYPMVGIFRRSPFLGETHVGNFFRKLAEGGDRVNRAIQDALYSSFRWASESIRGPYRTA